jgi:predicted DNA-binding transcriptional regulator AlpA
MSSVDESIAQVAQGEVERAVERALSTYATPAAEYLNTAQAARYVGLSEEYLEIARHKADSSGPNYIKLPRAVRYARADLDAWMERHRKVA